VRLGGEVETRLEPLSSDLDEHAPFYIARRLTEFCFRVEAEREPPADQAFALPGEVEPAEAASMLEAVTTTAAAVADDVTLAAAGDARGGVDGSRHGGRFGSSAYWAAISIRFPPSLTGAVFE
jgi:hypothetical protein